LFKVPRFAIVLFLILHPLSSFAREPTLPLADPVERRVEGLLRQLRLEEKIDLISGVDDFFIRGIPRLGIPPLKMADGPFGVRNFGPATTMGGIALAATWNPSLVERVGVEIGRDARAKGVHFLLGPGVNIYRNPLNGRDFEYFGEDPFLASGIAVGYINGLQSQGVSATIKHFIGNNSEFDRHNTDSVIDERTMREIYLPVFESAVKDAHVGAIMDSYNLVNGAHMTQNAYLNTDVAKQEWGFNGIIMSDWNATYDSIAAANGGMDLEMPAGKYFNRKNLLPALNDGTISIATIDNKVRRILRTAIRFGWFDREQTDLAIPRYNWTGRETALEAARESIVLLKNENGFLPLNKQKIKSIAVIGPNAYPAVPVGGGSAHVEPFTSISILEGVCNYIGPRVPVYYNRGLPSFNEIIAATNFSTAEASAERGLKGDYFSNPDFQGAPAVSRVDRQLDFGTAAASFGVFPAGTLSIRWSGYYLAKESGLYEISANGSFYRLYVDDKEVIDNRTINKALVSHKIIQLERGPHKILLERHSRAGRIGSRMQVGIAPQSKLVDLQAKKLAGMADVVVLAVGFDPTTEGEGEDRTFDLPIGQDELIREVTNANKKTIVVLTSGGGVDMNEWLQRMPAVIESWYPGQEGGRALAEILFGEVNPSGRLPVTFEQKLEDNPTFNSYYPESNSNRVVYKEGVFVGYRGFEDNGTKPLFPFGYGLSYTTFKYSNLSIKPLSDRASMSDLSETRYEVSFNITDTGSREGAEIAQLYIGAPHGKVRRPLKELKGFSKVMLHPGETKHVSVILGARAFSYYDVDSKQWRVESGNYDVLIGRSLDQMELRGKLALPSAVISK